VPIEVDAARVRVHAVLRDDFKVAAERLDDAAHLRVDLRLDSLALTDLAVLVQQDFGFKVTPDQFRGVTTVGALIAFVAAHATR
jgi:acyl carrier protein